MPTNKNTTSDSTANKTGERLNRTLGLAECIFFGVGSILGAGIYTIVGKVAGHAGNMLWASFLIATLAAALTAFSYAELSAAFPKAGGEFVYAKQAFHRKVAAFLGGLITLNGIVSGATVSLAFAGYLAQLLSWPQLPASLGIIALMLLVNSVGIRQSSTVNIIFTLIEAAGLVLVIAATWSSFGKVSLTQLPPEGVNGLLLGGALSFFAYIGFEEIVKLAEETKKPERNIPKALFIACGIVACIYLTIGLLAVSAMPWQELKESEAPLADLASQRFGSWATIAIAVIALFATTNTILSNMLGSSRVLLDMSDEYRLLKPFSTIWESRKTPVPALLLIAALMCAFALIGNIEQVALIANFFIFISFLLVNLAVIVLRHQQPDLKRPFTVPFTVGKIPLPSLLGLLVTLLLSGYSLYGLFSGKA